MLSIDYFRDRKGNSYHRHPAGKTGPDCGAGGADSGGEESRQNLRYSRLGSQIDRLVYDLLQDRGSTELLHLVRMSYQQTLAWEALVFFAFREVTINAIVLSAALFRIGVAFFAARSIFLPVLPTAGFEFVCMVYNISQVL